MNTTLIIYSGATPVKSFPPGSSKVVQESDDEFTVVFTDNRGTWTNRFEKPAHSYKRK